MSDYPFAFVGSGDANYFEWAEVHVLFEREPTADEQAAIAERVPPPLRDSIDFDGTHLMVASDQIAHAHIMDAYDKDPEDESEDEFEGRFPFAATSKVRAFNEDTAEWLRYCDEQCPILVGFRHEDWEAGGTELDAWHEWSVVQLDAVFERLDPDDLNRGELWTVRGLLEYAAESIADIPDRWRDIALPGQSEVDAIESGDVAALRAALQSRTARWDDAIERIAEQVDTDEPEQLRTLAAGADLLIEQMLDDSMGVLLARAALEPDVAGRDDILRAVAEACERSSWLGSLVGQLAYEMMREKRWEDALLLYDRLVELPDTDLTTYNNALYAVMDDNSALGVQPERAQRYVAAALPHAPDNPAIFYNAACIYMELGDTPKVYENIRRALEHGFHDPQQIRDEPVFEPIRDGHQFAALFDDGT